MKCEVPTKLRLQLRRAHTLVGLQLRVYQPSATSLPAFSYESISPRPSATSLSALNLLVYEPLA